jgi:hypothetical protein
MKHFGQQIEWRRSGSSPSQAITLFTKKKNMKHIQSGHITREQTASTNRKLHNQKEKLQSPRGVTAEATQQMQPRCKHTNQNHDCVKKMSSG